jgi:hypothetical protein
MLLRQVPVEVEYLMDYDPSDELRRVMKKKTNVRKW